MRVLLINCPVRENSKPNILPTGLGIIASALKLNGHEVELLDINALRTEPDDVANYINRYVNDYDLVGISGLVTTYKYQRWLIQHIRRRSSVRIACGGGIASSKGHLHRYGADYIVPGEGEFAMLKLAGTEQTYQTLDDLPFPDYDILDMDIYLKNPIWGGGLGNSSGRHPDMIQSASVNMVTSRGCPFSCNFCLDPFGRKYRQRSVDNVISEIRLIQKNYNIDFIGFVDDNMFVNEKWVLEFCDKMKDIGILWGCHARVNEVNDVVLKAAYGSGCRWIGYGIESGSQRILDNMNKGVKVGQAADAVSLTRKHGIYPNTTFIYGYPGENEETVKETVRFCQDLGISPEFFHSTAYPGTKLYKDNEGRIMAKYGNFEAFLEILGDAKDYTINLTEMPDTEYMALKLYLERSVK